MKISYNSLKKYIDTNLSPQELSVILTDIGLEVESIEKHEIVKGGMSGLVTGEVLTCEKHPNAEKLNLTTVNIGNGENLSIVCGASNVAKGQKVIVAGVGTKLYFNNDEIKIKKTRIRGEVSEGMICAEDEIGLGTLHEGIIVLPNETPIGIPAKEIFNIEPDYIIEIGLTPNRADGTSHIGVARDLSAYFKYIGKDIDYEKPSVENFKIDNKNLTIPVEITNKEACRRYAGITISGIEVKESPDWLKNHLKTLGLSPINNVVDLTNFVLHETGQPLHAFDADKISGNKVIVKTLKEGTKFITLDEVERKLSSTDLMICNTSEPMCIAGVFGGAQSGVTEKTKNIFIESAYFNPVSIRKTSKLHALQTDASFRFERGVDPDNIIYALKRAALLIKELAGGQISSEVIDIYPEHIDFFEIDILYSHINRLIGKNIPKETVKTIIKALEMQIVLEKDDLLKIKVPPYRVDVTREADVIEDILRIYGYNNVEISEKLNSTISYAPKPDTNNLKNIISEFLTSAGFNEAISNSLTKGSYYDNSETYKPENLVKILNPLSSDLNVLRQSILFNSLEAVIKNINYKNSDVKLYEFGNVYQFSTEKGKENPLDKYNERNMIALTISGNKETKSWNTKELKTDLYTVKSIIEKILLKLNFDILKFKTDDTSSDIFAYGLKYSLNSKTLVELGSVSKKYLSIFDIEQEVFYAEIYWDNIIKMLPKRPVFKEIPKFPMVKRDLALLLDKNIKFSDIRDLAYKSERKLLKNINIFDVFEDKKLGDNKKSYAISFYLQDEEKTLTDKQIDKIMQKLIYTFEKNLSAILR